MRQCSNSEEGGQAWKGGRLAARKQKAEPRGAADWAGEHELNSVSAAGAKDVPDGKRQRSSDGWGTRIQRGGSQKKFPESDEQDGKNGARPLSQNGMRVHPNVEYDGCGVHPIRGTRIQSKARPRRPRMRAWPAAWPLCWGHAPAVRAGMRRGACLPAWLLDPMYPRCG